MDILKSINIALRFILELCLVGAMLYVGWNIPANIWLKWLSAIGLAVITVSVWGYFIAPKAEHLLDQPYRLLVELLLFGLAVVSLGLLGQLRLAVMFAVVVCVNETLLIIWKQ